MQLHLEIRAAEGGDDAKALVLVQAALYEAYAKRHGLAVNKKAELGWLLLELRGTVEALEPLRAEAGGHRWQRQPPGERRERTHSSTVTVAVLNPSEQAAVSGLLERDVQMRFTRDRGPGGQHKNKTDSCVVLTHLPSGITVKVDGRNQHENRRQAWAELERRVQAVQERRSRQALAAQRSAQVGSGERADKIRTYREQDARATDHRTGRGARLADIKAGRLELLWE